METPLRAFAAKMVDLSSGARHRRLPLSPAMLDMMVKEKAAEDLRASNARRAACTGGAALSGWPAPARRPSALLDHLAEVLEHVLVEPQREGLDAGQRTSPRRSASTRSWAMRRLSASTRSNTGQGPAKGSSAGGGSSAPSTAASLAAGPARSRPAPDPASADDLRLRLPLPAAPAAAPRWRPRAIEARQRRLGGAPLGLALVAALAVAVGLALDLDLRAERGLVVGALALGDELRLAAAFSSGAAR
jgi:hypothetical protein